MIIPRANTHEWVKSKVGQGNNELWAGSQLQLNMSIAAPQIQRSDPPPEGKPVENIHILAVELIP